MRQAMPIAAGNARKIAASIKIEAAIKVFRRVLAYATVLR
jgi:hypothetical protein